MQLSDAAIREFQALYLAEVGAETSEEAARQNAERLIALVKFIYELD